MNQREAKRYACRVAAESIRSDINSGAHWFYEEDDRSEEDVARVMRALVELMEELWRRAGYEKVGGGEDG